MKPELSTAVDEGLLDMIDDSMFKFAHHSIEAFVYELIPEKNRKLLHKTIGKVRRNKDDSIKSYTEVLTITIFSCFPTSKETSKELQ